MRVAVAMVPDVRELLRDDPSQLAELLEEIHEEDLADLIELLEDSEAIQLLEHLPTEEAADIFERLEEHEQTELIEQFGPRRLAPIVSEQRTLGVIAIGHPARRLRDQKRLIKLIADLGSMALNNADIFSKLNDIANRDPLTQLGNKRFVGECLGQLIDRKRRWCSCVLGSPWEADS